jgi:hypothetical protein
VFRKTDSQLFYFYFTGLEKKKITNYKVDNAGGRVAELMMS